LEIKVFKAKKERWLGISAHLGAPSIFPAGLSTIPVLSTSRLAAGMRSISGKAELPGLERVEGKPVNISTPL